MAGCGEVNCNQRRSRGDVYGSERGKAGGGEGGLARHVAREYDVFVIRSRASPPVVLRRGAFLVSRAIPGIDALNWGNVSGHARALYNPIELISTFSRPVHLPRALPRVKRNPDGNEMYMYIRALRDVNSRRARSRARADCLSRGER